MNQGARNYPSVGVFFRRDQRSFCERNCVWNKNSHSPLSLRRRSSVRKVDEKMETEGFFSLWNSTNPQLYILTVQMVQECLLFLAECNPLITPFIWTILDTGTFFYDHSTSLNLHALVILRESLLKSHAELCEKMLRWTFMQGVNEAFHVAEKSIEIKYRVKSSLNLWKIA